VIVGGAFPQAARRAIRYGQGWIPHSQKLDETGLGATIERFRTMAREAGRDPADLPITMFRVPDDVERLRFCQQIGVDRVVFSLPEKKEAEMLPILDRWAAIKKELGV
jgi:alkanesulfonate monooxygenase SsuD/methylene tetrahydromethanopterin reductase-like flavin-dependent oxidoreductase (luciferase family)